MRSIVRVVLACTFVLGWTATAHSQDYSLAPFARLQTEQRDDISVVAFSTDGNMLLAGDKNGNMHCWNLERKVLTTTIEIGDKPVFAGFLSGDKSVVTVDGSGTVSIVDLLGGKKRASFECKGKPLRAALDAGKQFLAVATSNDRIEIFDLKGELPLGAIDARDRIEDLMFLGFDRLGEQLVAITLLGDVTGWNPATLKPIRQLALAGGELHGSRSVITAAATNRAANVFVVGLEEVAIPKGGIARGGDLLREDRAIAYDWNSGTEVKRVKLTWSIEQMALGPGNDHIAVVNDVDHAITLIDLRRGELGSSVSAEEKAKVLAVSEDNRWLAAGFEDGIMMIWSIKGKGAADVRTSQRPSLSGRIRTRSGTEPALPPGVPTRLAILNFEAKGVPQDVADVCMNSMSNALANFDYITLVERKQIESVIKEQQFQMSDLTDEKTSVRVGKLLNANIVLSCSIGKLGTSMILTARLLDVETGKVIKGREVICEECRDQDIYDAVSTLVSTIAQ